MMRASIRIIIGSLLICVGLITVWPFIPKRQLPSTEAYVPKKEPEASPPIEDVLSPTTFDTRLKSAFPDIYLTLISIIEGVAVYTLSANTYSYVVTYSAPTFPHLLGYFPYWVQYVPFSLTSFVLVVIVAYEYMWFVALFRWLPRLLDITIPLGLGFFEILPMYYFTNLFGYCLTITLVCFCGTFAYWYSWRRYPLVDIAKGFTKSIHSILEQTYRVNIVFSLMSGAVFLTLSVFVSQNFFKIQLNSYLQEILVWSLFIILEVIILFEADKSLKDLRRAFHLPENKSLAGRWFPWLSRSL